MRIFRSARARLAARIVCALAALTPTLAAQTIGVLDTLQQPDSQTSVGFGVGSSFADSVAVSGSWAVVGEPGFRIPGLGFAGRILILRRDVHGQWSTFQTFDGSQLDGTLGQSVAISATTPHEVTIVAGAPGANSAKFILYRDGLGGTLEYWTTSTVTPSQPAEQVGEFGAAVATNGNFTLVGQPHRGAGFVYVYHRPPGFDFAGPLGSFTQASALGQASEFGASLAMSGSTALIGAPNYHVIDGLQPSVFVYRFTQTAWPLDQRLAWAFSGGTYSLGFGKSVAIDGDRCVVGAPDTTVAGHAGAGRAIAFTRSGLTWTQERVYEAAVPEDGAAFGFGVAVDGDDVAVGAPEASGGQGRVRVYNGAANGALAFEAVSPTPNVADRFGAAVAFDASFVLAGDPGDNGGRGTLYAYQWDGPDCDANGIGDLYEIENGTSADLDVDGVPDECQSPTCLLEELNAANGAASDQLGWSIATDGERVISGAVSKVNAGGIAAGAAVVYRRDGTHLVQEALLAGTNVHAGDSFGECVAIESDLVFVGAPGDDTGGGDAGALYVFRRDPSTGAWLLETKLLAPDAAAGATFGRSVAYAPQLSGALFVGSDGANSPAASASGKVYVFERSGTAWIHRNTLFDFNGATGDAFGYSVSIRYNTLAIGAPYADPSGISDAGKVHVGSVSAALASPVTLVEFAQTVPQPGSHLGYSVAVSRNGLVAAGAPQDPTRGFTAGSVQLYLGSPSSPVLVPLYLSGGNDWDSFGTSVAWADDRLLAGMPFVDTAQAQGAGQVCIYKFDAAGSLRESARISAPDGNFNQAFGRSVAWRDGLLAAGAYGDDLPNGTDSGSAYAFGLGGGDCNTNGTCDLCEIRAGTVSDANQNGVSDACDVRSFCFGDGSGAPCPCGNESPANSGGCRNSFGTAGTLFATGAASVANDTLVISAVNMPASTTALFFQGTAQDGGGSGITFADGVRCVSGAIVRLRTRVASVGTASYPMAGDAAIHVRGNVLAGETRYYQVHYRNASSTFCSSSTSNYTNGVAALWTP